MKKKQLKKGLVYLFLIVFGLFMIYPLVWLFFASFKTNAELFGTTKLLPESFSLDGLVNGWKSSGKFTYAQFYLNTFRLVLPTVLLTVLSTGLVSYGFARFNFPMKSMLFAIMIATLMLPDSVVIIPRYILYSKLGWADTYYPFWVPALLACYPFFIYQQIQFMRAIPTELDESVCMDGCNPLQTYIHILFPLMKPAVFSVIIFQFLWRWNDYFNNLIYISSVNKYTVSLALKMSIDSTGSATAWNQVLSMSLVSMIPPTLLFFLAQNYFVEGMTAGSVKG